MDEELATRLVTGSNVVVVGSPVEDVTRAMEARQCVVTLAGETASSGASATFDAALLVEFRETWGEAADVLRRVRALLRDDGRLLVSRLQPGAAALRIAMNGLSEHEPVAPPLREIDLERHAASALAELVASAGFRSIAGTPDDMWLEAMPNVAEEPLEQRTGQRQVVAGAEARELRAVVRSVLERQQRLHEELARLRAAIAWRDIALADVRARLDEELGARALAAERLTRLEAMERQLHEAAERIADLDARRIRLTEAVVELRES